MKVSIWLDRKTLFAKEMEIGNHNRSPIVSVEVSLNAFEKLVTVYNFCCSDAYNNKLCCEPIEQLGKKWLMAFVKMKSWMRFMPAK